MNAVRRVSTTSTNADFYSDVFADVYAAAVERLSTREDEVYQSLLETCRGPALELGSGTGRLLLKYLAAGFDVDGIDRSEEMLEVCRETARKRGLAVNLRYGSFAPLPKMNRPYGLIYCPLNTFSLIEDREKAVKAVASAVENLGPSGYLAISASSSRPESSATESLPVSRPDVLVNGRRCHVEESRWHERGAAGGAVVVKRTVRVPAQGYEATRYQRRLVWEPQHLASLFNAHRLGSLRMVGSSDDYVLIGQR